MVKQTCYSVYANVFMLVGLNFYVKPISDCIGFCKFHFYFRVPNSFVTYFSEYINLVIFVIVFLLRCCLSSHALFDYFFSSQSLFSVIFTMVLNSLMLFLLFSCNLCSILVQFLNVTIFCSPVWQETLFIVMPEVIGFVHIYFCGFLFVWNILVQVWCLYIIFFGDFAYRTLCCFLMFYYWFRRDFFCCIWQNHSLQIWYNILML
jgi:hypothetical protein